MLTYVAILLLSGMVYGPLKNPDGFNFQRVAFHDSGTLPIILPGTKAHIGFNVALAGLMYYLLRGINLGFMLKFLESPQGHWYFQVNQVIIWSILASLFLVHLRVWLV